MADPALRSRDLLDALHQWLTEADGDDESPAGYNEYYLRSDLVALYEEAAGLREKVELRGLPLAECREDIAELCRKLDAVDEALGRLARAKTKATA